MRAEVMEAPRDWIADEREAVVAEARSWVGTKFHHGAGLKGVGVDCAHLLIECFAVVGVARPPLEPYAPDWFLHEEGPALDRFTRWVARYCDATPVPSAGDIALFRYGRAVSHAAIVVEVEPDPVVVHSFRELGVVLGSVAPTHDLFPRLAGWWRLRRWSTATEAIR